MAMFHLSTKTISRKTGRTATASAAYRAGEKIHCERTGETHDYTRKWGVMASSAFLFDGDKKITLDRQDLWNTAERAEKRKDARTAREIVVNLPHELTPDQRQHLVDDFTKSLAKSLGVAIDYAIHEPNKRGDDRNYHAHILMTTRTASMDNGALVLGAKSNIELENKALKAKGLPSTQAQITSIRKDWADYTNHHLRKAGLDITIDHRSHAERGLEIAPTIKMGVSATAMERRGIKTDKGNFNRAIKQANNELRQLNDELIYQNSQDYDTIMDKLEQEQEWDNHPYALASEPPAPKPKPKPAPPPPPPPKPIIISLPLTASYIPGGFNRPLYQQPTVAIGHYKGCKEFESGFVRTGQVDIDLSTMQILNETISNRYPDEYRDDFATLIRNHTYAFLGRDDAGNEKMGFDKYNDFIKSHHRTSFQCDASFHDDINQAFDYLQRTPPAVQQVQARQEHDNTYDYDR